MTGGEFFDANPTWSQDGKMLYFTSDRDRSQCLWAVRMDPATGKAVGEPFAIRHFHTTPRKYFGWVPTFAVTRDRIVISLEQVQSDIWMLKLPDQR